MGLLTRVIKKALDEARKPESYVKGDEFEYFVTKSLFPDSNYYIVHRTHDYTSNRDGFVESSKAPDFKFRSRISGKQFFVEAKYRTGLYNGALEWCKPYQLTRYKAIDNKTPVCIAIGVGGQPTAPEQVFLIPMKHIKYTKLFPSFLRKYKISKIHCITEKELFTLLQ